MVFTAVQMALTSVTVAVLAFALAAWRLPRPTSQPIVIAVLAGAAVFLWRMSANMPQVNDDGVPGFSANDWAARILTYVVLAGYADLRPPTRPATGRCAPLPLQSQWRSTSARSDPADERTPRR